MNGKKNFMICSAVEQKQLFLFQIFCYQNGTNCFDPEIIKSKQNFLFLSTLNLSKSTKHNIFKLTTRVAN